ncbi:GntR family transcriptional regulator [Streptomyces uncialis]|uniref:GntR family transcriptional regulator n=1 Tax=Streptomyces uncialis TaxID=1048205 RepID=UPI003F4CD14C
MSPPPSRGRAFLDVAAQVAVNPNTALKAYRELEYEGLVAPRPGVGTFVTRTLDDIAHPEYEALRANWTTGRSGPGPPDWPTRAWRHWS